MGKEMGAGFRMGDTCTPMADSTSVSWSVKWSRVQFPGHGITLPDGELSRVLLTTARQGGQAGRPGSSRRGCAPLGTFFRDLFFYPPTIQVTLPEHTVQWFSVYSQGWATTTPNSKTISPTPGGKPARLATTLSPSPTLAADTRPLAAPWPCPFWTFHISTITQHVGFCI